MEDPVVTGLAGLTTLAIALAGLVGKLLNDKRKVPQPAPVLVSEGMKPVEEETLKDVEELLKIVRPIADEINTGDFIKIKDIMLERDAQGRPRAWFPSEPLEKLTRSVEENTAKVEKLELLINELLNLSDRRNL